MTPRYLTPQFCITRYMVYICFYTSKRKLGDIQLFKNAHVDGMLYRECQLQSLSTRNTITQCLYMGCMCLFSYNGIPYFFFNPIRGRGGGIRPPSTFLYLAQKALYLINPCLPTFPIYLLGLWICKKNSFWIWDMSAPGSRSNTKT